MDNNAGIEKSSDKRAENTDLDASSSPEVKRVKLGAVNGWSSSTDSNVGADADHQSSNQEAGEIDAESTCKGLHKKNIAESPSSVSPFTSPPKLWPSKSPSSVTLFTSPPKLSPSKSPASVTPLTSPPKLSPSESPSRVLLLANPPKISPSESPASVPPFTNPPKLSPSKDPSSTTTTANPSELSPPKSSSSVTPPTTPPKLSPSMGPLNPQPHKKALLSHLEKCKIQALQEHEKFNHYYKKINVQKINYPKIQRTHVKSTIEFKEAMNEANRNAVKGYTIALALAKTTSEKTEAYLSRAEILMKMEKNALALVDFNRALELGLSTVDMSAAQRLKATCVDRLLREESGLNMTKVNEPESKISSSAVEIPEIRVSSPSASFRNLTVCESVKDFDYAPTISLPPSVELNESLPPYVSKNISMKYSVHDFKNLTVEKEIKPGQWLMTVQPFCTMLKADYFTSYCSHCAIFCQNLIPCNSCSMVMFCCTSCQSEAMESYHRIECQYLSHLVSDRRSFYEMLALRVLMKATEQGTKLNEMFEKNHFEGKENAKTTKMHTEHRHILNKIKISPENMCQNEQMERCHETLYLLHVLYRVNFFKNCKCLPRYEKIKNLPRELSQNVLKFCSYLMKTLWRTRICTHAITVADELTKKSLRPLVHIGGAMYPLLFRNVTEKYREPNVTLGFFKNYAFVYAMEPMAPKNSISFACSCSDWNTQCANCKASKGAQKSTDSISSQLAECTVFKKMDWNDMKRQREEFRKTCEKYKKNELLSKEDWVQMCNYLGFLHASVRSSAPDWARCKEIIHRIVGYHVDVQMREMITSLISKTIYQPAESAYDEQVLEEQ